MKKRTAVFVILFLSFTVTATRATIVWDSVESTAFKGGAPQVNFNIPTNGGEFLNFNIDPARFCYEHPDSYLPKIIDINTTAINDYQQEYTSGALANPIARAGGSVIENGFANTIASTLNYSNFVEDDAINIIQTPGSSAFRNFTSTVTETVTLEASISGDLNFDVLNYNGETEDPVVPEDPYYGYRLKAVVQVLTFSKTADQPLQAYIKLELDNDTLNDSITIDLVDDPDVYYVLQTSLALRTQIKNLNGYYDEVLQLADQTFEIGNWDDSTLIVPVKLTSTISIPATLPENIEAMVTKTPTFNGVNLEGEWQPGSSFILSITNDSTRNFRIDQAELKNGNESINSIVETTLLSDGLLEPAESLSLGFTLDNAMQDNGMIFTYSLIDVPSGEPFEITQEYDLYISYTYYRDFDEDGYGNPDSLLEAATQPSGYVTDNSDCNDVDETIHPGATEIRGDGIDQDCNGTDLPSLANPGQYLTLTDSSPTILISGSVAHVYGCGGENNIIMEKGAGAKLINFPGSNTITIQSDASIFTIYRSGATVTFEGTDGTVLIMPATTTAQLIIFNDKHLNLKLDSSSVMLDNQKIGTERVMIE